MEFTKNHTEITHELAIKSKNDIGPGQNHPFDLFFLALVHSW